MLYAGNAGFDKPRPCLPSPHRIWDWWKEQQCWDFWTDYRNGIWEPHTREIIDEHVTEGSTFVDIGAWIGPTALWGAEQAERVLAIEPDPVAFELLEENVSLCANIETVPGAIADHTGTAFLCPSIRLEGMGSSMSRLEVAQTDPIAYEWNAREKVEVECWTLPDFFDRFHVENVSLVKMDIEGGEAQILGEVCPFLAGRGIPLCVSLHPAWYAEPMFDETCFDAFSEIFHDGKPSTPLLAVP